MIFEGSKIDSRIDETRSYSGTVFWVFFICFCFYFFYLFLFEKSTLLELPEPLLEFLCVAPVLPKERIKPLVCLTLLTGRRQLTAEHHAERLSLPGSITRAQPGGADASNQGRPKNISFLVD